MSTLLLEAKSLSHSFDYPLYQDVDLTLEGGESVAIVGRSGSGKSTLLHTLATFLRPDKGSVSLLGQEIYAMDTQSIEAVRRDELGIIFQAHYLFKGMTGRENIEIVSLLSGEMPELELLRELEIDKVIDQKIGDLSGGQQQRVSIARVLGKKPKIIFADEPTGNLDNHTAMLVMDVLLRYVKNHEAVLFLVTHDTSIARRCTVQYRLEGEALSRI